MWVLASLLQLGAGWGPPRGGRLAAEGGCPGASPGTPYCMTSWGLASGQAGHRWCEPGGQNCLPFRS